MSPKKVLYLFLISIIILISCKDEVTDSNTQTGSLVLSAVKELPTQLLLNSKTATDEKNRSTDGITVGMISIKLTITGIYVSQGTVVDGGTNDLTWHQIGTNSEMKLFEDYSFSADNLPAGRYNSLKMTYTGDFYRQMVRLDDPSQTFLALDGPIGDDGVNYFSANGSHRLEGNHFVLESSGERVTGFDIRAGEVTQLYWKLGDERPWNSSRCTYEWDDTNNNGTWDDGVDALNEISCDANSMWIFVTVYE